MASLKGFAPIPVNSKKNILSTDPFNWDFVQREKKQSGALIVTAALGNNTRSSGVKNPFAGFDVMQNDFVASCVLIDYNYILMCFHSFLSFSDGDMRKKDVHIIFANEYTQGSIDTTNPKPELKRPMAFLRGDLGWWGAEGANQCKDDFALVQIEWNKSNGTDDDIHMFGRMAELPDPATFNSSSLLDKKVGCILQYAPDQPVQQSLKDQFSNHVAWGKVTKLNQAPKIEECLYGKDPLYAYAEFRSRFGSSGSGVYNTSGEIVGILVGMSGYQTFFLPLDKIYQSLSLGSKEKITTMQKMQNIYDYRKANKK
jgi:hypothetical protein